MSARSSLLTLSVLIAPFLACSSDKTDPQPSAPQTVSVVSFNLFLAGAFSPFETERRQPIVDTIASMDTDIVCLQEAWRGSDKDLIIAAAKSSFPYAVKFDNNLDTPVNDPTDQNGALPPERTQPPCAAQEQIDKLDLIVQCMAKNCSSIPGSVDGVSVSTECVVQKCQTAAVALLMGTEADKQCYSCAAPQLPTETIKAIRDKCITNPKAGMAFDGQSSVLLLSKFPLENAEQYVLPATWNRRIVIRATARLPNGAALDVYCNHLSAAFYQIAYPYLGFYGKGQTDSKGWENEIMLQAQRLAGWVEEKSGARKAIVAGDFNAGPELKDYGIEPDGAAEYAFLSGKFTEALAAGFKPECTYCSKNGNVLASAGASPNSWIDHIFVKNIPVSDIKSTTRFLVDPIVPVTTAIDGGELGQSPPNVPLSDHYAIRTTFTIQP